MKGMQKISRGSGFHGVLQYAFDRDEGTMQGMVIGGNMAGDDIRTLNKEFGNFRKLRTDIEKPVWHNSLRIPEGETLPDDTWNEIGMEYMRRMGFDEHRNQFCFVRHDTDHIHIIANRIDVEGNIWYGKNENITSTRIIAELEKDFNLTITKNLEYIQDEQGNWSIAPGQETGNRRHLKAQLMNERIENDPDHKAAFKVKPLKEELKDLVQEAASAPGTVVEFADKLASWGVEITPVIKKKDSKQKDVVPNLVGFSLTYKDSKYKGSDVGCTISQLNERGITYDNARDNAPLLDRKKGLVVISVVERPIIEPAPAPVIVQEPEPIQVQSEPEPVEVQEPETQEEAWPPVITLNDVKTDFQKNEKALMALWGVPDEPKDPARLFKQVQFDRIYRAWMDVRDEEQRELWGNENLVPHGSDAALKKLAEKLENYNSRHQFNPTTTNDFDPYDPGPVLDDVDYEARRSDKVAARKAAEAAKGITNETNETSEAAKKKKKAIGDDGYDR